MSNETELEQKLRAKVKAERQRGNRLLSSNKEQRAKIRALRKRNAGAIRDAFIRGSTVAIAHQMASFEDDALMLAFTEQVRASIEKRTPNAGAVAAVVESICKRHKVEFCGRELIETVYLPKISGSRS